jgi:hypothetical protein
MEDALMHFALGHRSYLGLLLLLLLLSAAARPAMATMYITGNGGLSNTDPQQYSRFYTGGDKAFIGQAYDWSGVGSGWATMISPSFFISATHAHPGAGSNVTFYPGNTTSGTSYTGIVAGGTQIQSTDIWLGWLTQAIPDTAHIAQYPILALANDSAYLGTTIYTYGSPNLVGRNVISGIGSYSEIGETMTGMFYNYDLPGVGADETYLMGGDSGSTSFAVVNGQLALLGEHFSNWGTSGLPGAPGNVAPEISDGVLINGDPNRGGNWWSVDGFASDYVSSINAAMAAAGSSERVTTVVPEPSSLILILAGLVSVAGLAIRRRLGPR